MTKTEVKVSEPDQFKRPLGDFAGLYRSKQGIVAAFERSADTSFFRRNKRKTKQSSVAFYSQGALEHCRAVTQERIAAQPSEAVLHVNMENIRKAEQAFASVPKLGDSFLEMAKYTYFVEDLPYVAQAPRVSRGQLATPTTGG